MFWWAGPLFSKSLIQFSVSGWGCVPSLLLDLRPNHSGGDEDNGDLLQKVPCTHCCTQCPQSCSRPPLTHASTRDSWTPMGMSGPVSCGVTALFYWVLVHTRFCLCPSRVCFPVLCKFWGLCGGVNGDLLPEGLCHTQVCCTQSFSPAAGRCWPVPAQETLRHSSGSVSVGSLGPGAHKVCLSPPNVSGGYGV